jgi:type IV pilus assembly protein PilV
MKDRIGHTPSRRFQRGFSLVEVLIAFLIVAFGMLGISRMNIAAIDATAQVKARATALDLAEQRIEQLRGLTATADYAALVDSNAAESINHNFTSFSRSWTVNKLTSAGAPRYAQIAVSVAWQDSEGVTRSVTLDSNVSEPEPDQTGRWYASAIKESAQDAAAAQAQAGG